LPNEQGGILCSQRARWSNEKTNHDAWFSAWFQSIRTACGMLLYGKKNQNTQLQEQARSLVRLLLSSPQRKGIFPSIYCLSEDGKSGEWIPDSGWAGYPDCYHAYDCSWTGNWLLTFLSLQPIYEDRILSFLFPYGEFLLKQQLPNGCLPSWYDASTLHPKERLQSYYPAETSGSALFLTRLYAFLNREEYLNGACRAMEFITREVIPTRKWSDFETYLARARKPYGFFDANTLQHPQSTLCMIQGAGAFLSLYRATLKPFYLERGKRVLDYLSLYQQVWSPPFLSAALFGGFGAQNTDGVWGDARACYAADLYFDYYEATRFREYFERGAAAMKSCFSLLPHENWSPDGTDRAGGITGIHWGVGSAAVSSLTSRLKYGDVFIDLSEGWGCTLNACRLENLSVDRYRISFDVKSDRSWESPAFVKFHGLRYGVYHLDVNGESLGTTPASSLHEGIPVYPLLDRE
jgi:hypothetical protein